jgi:hypothetical protein
MPLTAEWANVIQSGLLTFVGLVISTITFTNSNRTNFGLPPILLLGRVLAAPNQIWVEMIFNNRRRYPIALQKIKAKFLGIEVDDTLIPIGNGPNEQGEQVWSSFANNTVLGKIGNGNVIVSPADELRFFIVVPLNPRFLPRSVGAKIELTAFDAQKNKRIKIRKYLPEASDRIIGFVGRRATA